MQGGAEGERNERSPVPKCRGGMGARCLDRHWQVVSAVWDRRWGCRPSQAASGTLVSRQPHNGVGGLSFRAQGAHRQRLVRRCAPRVRPGLGLVGLATCRRLLSDPGACLIPARPQTAAEPPPPVPRPPPPLPPPRFFAPPPPAAQALKPSAAPGRFDTVANREVAIKVVDLEDM